MTNIFYKKKSINSLMNPLIVYSLLKGICLSISEKQLWPQGLSYHMFLGLQAKNKCETMLLDLWHYYF